MRWRNESVRSALCLSFKFLQPPPPPPPHSLLSVSVSHSLSHALARASQALSDGPLIALPYLMAVCVADEWPRYIRVTSSGPADGWTDGRITAGPGRVRGWPGTQMDGYGPQSRAMQPGTALEGLGCALVYGRTSGHVASDSGRGRGACGGLPAQGPGLSGGSASRRTDCQHASDGRADHALPGPERSRRAKCGCRLPVQHPSPRCHLSQCRWHGHVARQP